VTRLHARPPTRDPHRRSRASVSFEQRQPVVKQLGNRLAVLLLEPIGEDTSMAELADGLEAQEAQTPAGHAQPRLHGSAARSHLPATTPHRTSCVAETRAMNDLLDAHVLSLLTLSNFGLLRTEPVRSQPPPTLSFPM
jgi:hypothetical protein